MSARFKKKAGEEKHDNAVEHKLLLPQGKEVAGSISTGSMRREAEEGWCVAVHGAENPGSVPLTGGGSPMVLAAGPEPVWASQHWL